MKDFKSTPTSWVSFKARTRTYYFIMAMERLYRNIDHSPQTILWSHLFGTTSFITFSLNLHSLEHNNHKF